MLDHIGCEYKGKGGTLEVIKDSKVVMVRQKMNDLFVVRGEAMVNGAYTVDKPNLIEADVWHKRLSHISQKGM